MAQTEALAISLVDRAISVLSVIVVGGIAYVFSNKTRGNPEFMSDGGTSTVRAPDVPAMTSPTSQGS